MKKNEMHKHQHIWKIIMTIFIFLMTLLIVLLFGSKLTHQNDLKNLQERTEKFINELQQICLTENLQNHHFSIQDYQLQETNVVIEASLPEFGEVIFNSNCDVSYAVLENRNCVYKELDGNSISFQVERKIDCTLSKNEDINDNNFIILTASYNEPLLNETLDHYREELLETNGKIIIEIEGLGEIRIKNDTTYYLSYEYRNWHQDIATINNKPLDLESNGKIFDVFVLTDVILIKYATVLHPSTNFIILDFEGNELIRQRAQEKWAWTSSGYDDSEDFIIEDVSVYNNTISITKYNNYALFTGMGCWMIENDYFVQCDKETWPVLNITDNSTAITFYEFIYLGDKQFSKPEIIDITTFGEWHEHEQCQFWYGNDKNAWEDC